MELGKKLKEARLNAKLTQDKVSETIQVSRQTLSNWENERYYPDIVSVIKLSDLYKISLDELLKGEKMNMSLNQGININAFTNVKGHKKILVVSLDLSVTPRYMGVPLLTSNLVIKMNKYTKKNKIDVTSKLIGYSTLEEYGEDADIILLTPELIKLEAEIKEKFPTKNVRIIDTRDYGISNAENVLKMALV